MCWAVLCWPPQMRDCLSYQAQSYWDVQLLPHVARWSPTVPSSVRPLSPQLDCCGGGYREQWQKRVPGVSEPAGWVVSELGCGVDRRQSVLWAAGRKWCRQVPISATGSGERVAGWQLSCDGDDSSYSCRSPCWQTEGNTQLALWYNMTRLKITFNTQDTAF